MSFMPFMKMLGTVLKHLFIGSPCKMYPVKKPVYYDNTRSKILIDTEKCVCCTLCDKKCPTGAIKVDREKKTWGINRFSCIMCGICVECCPKKCLSMSSERPLPATEKSEETFEIKTPETTAKK